MLRPSRANSMAGPLSKGLLVLLLTALPAGAWGASLIHAETDLVLDLPEGWEVDTSPGVVFAQSPRAEVAVILMTSQVADTQALVADAPNRLQAMLRRPVVEGEPTLGQVNGLPEATLSGSALDGEEPVAWTLRLVKHSGKHLVVVTYGQLERHAALVQALYGSIRPAPLRGGRV